MTKGELINGILKGLGRRPTSQLLRWNPTFRKPHRFDLLEVSKCEADGDVVTPTMPQHRRSVHAGHEVKSPKYYSVLDFLKVQLRIIK